MPSREKVYKGRIVPNSLKCEDAISKSFVICSRSKRYREYMGETVF